MGLDFSHGPGAHWSYSGFNVFRRRIAMSIGVISSIDEELYDNGVYKFLINEPIYPLINHSDCEGELTVEEMKQIIPQLKIIIDKWKVNSAPAIEYDIANGEAFIEAMEEAIKYDENLEFR